MKKKTMLITAGPTREHIDPVRFISNESSGTVGYEIAREAMKKGYDVILILGPVSLPDLPGAKIVRITSAKDLLREIKTHLPDADILVMSAAVADFTPVSQTRSKIKREKDITLQLKKNPDILQTISTPRWKKNKTYVGFCLETERLKERAKDKLTRKNLDYIIGTSLKPKMSPFGKNLFAPLVLSRQGKVVQFEPMEKARFAREFLSILSDDDC